MCKTPFGSQRGGGQNATSPSRTRKLIISSFLRQIYMTNYLNCPSAMTIPPEWEEMRNEATFPATSETANV